MPDVLYLSRLTFPLSRFPCQRLLVDPYQIHRALMAAFPTPAGRVLFRVEPVQSADASACVLVQSEDEPRWGRATLPAEVQVDPVKPFHLFVPKGRHLRFRLLANPTVKKKADGRKHGRRQGILKEEDQLRWLERKGEAGGFRIARCTAIDEGMITTCKQERSLSFKGIRFEGILVVSDPGKFQETVRSGIGSAKGLGFGLLSLAPV